MSAPAFVPVLLFKDGRYQVAYSQAAVLDRQWDGWAVVSLYDGPPQLTIEERLVALEDYPPGGGTFDYLQLNNRPTIPDTPDDIGAASVAALVAETNRATTVEAEKLDADDSSVTNPRAPLDGSVTNSKVAVAAEISADKLADGVTNKLLTTVERIKLAGIGTAATANSTDAQLRDRAMHVGLQPSTSISDFSEAVQDAVSVLLGAGSNVTLSYDDAADTLTVSAATTGGAGLDAESVRDAIGVALIGVGNIAVVVNDAADTITISTTATANSTDVALRDRTTHTGEQIISTVNGLQGALDAKLLATDASVTNARIPTAHATSHVTGGTDPITASSIGAIPNAGASTIAGVKTFSASPIVPTPTTAGQAATKGYVDAAGGTGGLEPVARNTASGAAQTVPATGNAFIYQLSVADLQLTMRPAVVGDSIALHFSSNSGSRTWNILPATGEALRWPDAGTHPVPGTTATNRSDFVTARCWIAGSWVMEPGPLSVLP